MACSNCFNGCAEIISDQCVKYTGNNISELGISNGDTLSAVESKIIEFILSLSNGTSIVQNVSESDLCTLVNSFLPTSGTIDINEIISAIFRSICSIQTNVSSIQQTLSVLNADYSIGCLQNVTASSDTHDILQAAITKLCATDSSLAALILDVSTNYVALSDLNSLIQAYLDSTAPSNLQKNKMVPYVAYEYYGPLTNFDATGAGSGQWENVYLCNGNNGTPDRRGRVAVGTTDGTMQGSTMNSSVNPSVSGNPSYTLAGIFGQNNVSLNATQIPSHSHTASATSTSQPHSHFIAKIGPDSGSLSAESPLDTEYDVPGTFGPERFSYRLRQTSGTANLGPTSPSTVSVSTSVIVNSTGGNLPHTNIQPSIGAYFIMYIP
jgi:microcystin-dependent protein